MSTEEAAEEAISFRPWFPQSLETPSTATAVDTENSAILSAWTFHSMSKLTHDVKEKAHSETLTATKNLPANLRITGSISGCRNEDADAALATVHRQWTTTIKHETMETQLVLTPGTQGDKLGEPHHDYEGERGERLHPYGESTMQQYLTYRKGGFPTQERWPLQEDLDERTPPMSHQHLQAHNPWLQHLSALSKGPLFEVPFARITTQLMPVNFSRERPPMDGRVCGKVSASKRRGPGGGKAGAIRSGRAQGPLSKEEQRRNACVRERTRMRDMNCAFDTLRRRLPYIRQHGKRVSKIEALRMTITYIKQLKEILSESNSNSQSYNALGAI